MAVRIRVLTGRIAAGIVVAGVADVRRHVRTWRRCSDRIHVALECCLALLRSKLLHESLAYWLGVIPIRDTLAGLHALLNTALNIRIGKRILHARRDAARWRITLQRTLLDLRHHPLRRQIERAGTFRTSSDLISHPLRFFGVSLALDRQALLIDQLGLRDGRSSRRTLIFHILDRS